MEHNGQMPNNTKPLRWKDSKDKRVEERYRSVPGR